MCRAFLSPWYERGGMNPADENDEPVFVGRFNLGRYSAPSYSNVCRITLWTNIYWVYILHIKYLIWSCRKWQFKNMLTGEANLICYPVCSINESVKIWWKISLFLIKKYIKKHLSVDFMLLNMVKLRKYNLKMVN